MSKLHLMNAAGQIPGPLLAELRPLAEAALLRHTERLGISGIDVAVRAVPWALAETGVGGYAPSGHYLDLNLDPSNPHFAAHWRTEVPATLAHELYHCARWRGPGYGQTLLEVLVSEGLAQHHEREERGGQPAPYSKLDLSLAPLWEQARPLLHSATYPHAEWFFGAGSLPRWAGYALGYELVGRLLGDTGQDAAAHAHTPAWAFAVFLD